MWYSAADMPAFRFQVAGPFGGKMLRMSRCLHAALLFSATAALGCHSPPSDSAPSEPDSNNQESLEQGDVKVVASPAGHSVRGQQVSWADDDSGLRLRAQGHDQLAMGPSAIAVTPQGNVLVLDRLAGRVARVIATKTTAKLRTLMEVPVDAEDLAVGPDGALLAFSPVRATAWLYESSGEPAGDMTVTRELRELQHIELGPSRTLQVRSAYQELINIGSPSAPLPLAVALKTKREGAALLADGRGVAVVVNERQAELRVLRQADQEHRSSVDARFTISGDVDGARVIGVDDTTACVRLEHVSSTPTITVTRRAYCVEVSDGKVVLDTELGVPGSYLPRRELAMGGGYLAFMRPDDSGVSFKRWSLRTPDMAKEVTP
jgi:hypothetical protein